MTTKYSRQNMVQWAASLGSSAQTLRGATKAVVVYMRSHVRVNALAGLRALDGETPYGIERSRGMSRSFLRPDGQYRTQAQQIQHRRKDALAKRLAADSAFRARELRKMSAEMKRLISPPLRSIGEISSAAASRPSRVSRAAEIARLKSIALGKPQATPEIPKISLGAGTKIAKVNFSAALARRHTAINMTGKDATLQPCLRPSHGRHLSATPSTYNGRKWSGFERAAHDNFVRSFALISEDCSAVDYIFHETQVSLVLPAGSRWDVDTNGLRVVCGPDDYHMDAGELLAKNAVEKIMAKFDDAAETRSRIAAQALVERAEAEGVWVSIEDSIRAGNCEQGTLAFALRHGLEPAAHHRASDLLAIGNGDSGRVRLAIRASLNRVAELEREWMRLNSPPATV